LALEVSKASKGTTFKDFKEKLSESEYQEKVKTLRDKVEKFSLQFPMPGLDEF
jgi:hypothetical protein